MENDGAKKKHSNWHLEYQAFSYLQTTTPLVNESNRFSKEIHCSSYFADKNSENNNNNQIKKNWLINHQIIIQNLHSILCNTFTFLTLVQIIFFLTFSKRMISKGKWRTEGESSEAMPSIVRCAIYEKNFYD